VSIYRPKRRAAGYDELDCGWFQAEYGGGLRPQQYVDVLALVGDAADHVPGVPKVGAKTAPKLVAEFGSIEGIYDRLSEVKPERIRRSLEEHGHLAELSKELVTIDCGVDIESAGVAAVSDLRMGKSNPKALANLFKELEFVALRKKASELGLMGDTAPSPTDGYTRQAGDDVYGSVMG
jgi:DNA polymerase-1